MSNLQDMNKFPSVSSIHSMVSLGYLPPGHGYIPKKQKPDKPYGPSYIAIMNRTWRGPGKKYLRYALVVFCLAMLFYISASLYFAHRNVFRMIVRHSEPTGACLLIAAIVLTALMFHLIHKARMESNRWRANIRFRGEGLFQVAPINEDYQPSNPQKLTTGTYGPRAVKEIPKPRYMRKSNPGSRAGGRMRAPGMTTVMEGDESPLIEEDMMRSQEDLTAQKFMPPTKMAPGGPMMFSNEPENRIHRPEVVRLDTPGQGVAPPSQEMPRPMVGINPLVHMPVESSVLTRATPDARPFPGARDIPDSRPPFGMRATPEPRLPPGVRATPEPRPPPGVRAASEPRPPPGIRATPEPRPPPGVRATPDPRPPPGIRATPDTRPPPGIRATPDPRPAPGSRATPDSRPPAGMRATPDPRPAPGVRSMPQPRPAPGMRAMSDSRPPAGARGVHSQVTFRGASESDLL